MSRNTTNSYWRGQRQEEMREGYQTSKIVHAGNRLIELLSCQGELPLKKKEEWLQGRAWGPEGEAIMGPESRTLTHSDVFSGLETSWNFPCWISNFIETSDPLCLLMCFPFGLGISILLQPCIWKADNVFSSFADPQLERNLSQEASYPESHPYLISCGLEDKIWDFELMLCRWDLGIWSWCWSRLGLLEILGLGECVLHVGWMWILLGQKAGCSMLSGDPAKRYVCF